MRRSELCEERCRSMEHSPDNAASEPVSVAPGDVVLLVADGVSDRYVVDDVYRAREHEFHMRLSPI
jgi:hypothetical protein